LEHRSYIERPRPEVFEAAATPEKELEWDPDGPIWMKKLSDGPLGPGTRYRGKWKRFGVLEWTFADFLTPEKVTHDAESSLGRIVHYLTFRDLAQNVTRFDQVLEFHPKAYLRPIHPVFKIVLARRMEHIARTLKAYLESSSTELQ
jgi:hypothetical protein